MTRTHTDTTPKGSNATNLLNSILAHDTTELDKAALNTYLGMLLAGRTPTIDTDQPIEAEWIKMPKGWIEQLISKVQVLFCEVEQAIESNLDGGDYTEELDDDGRQSAVYQNSSWESFLDEREWLSDLEIALNEALEAHELTQQPTTPRLVIA